jgi:ribosomal protein L11 methylase PrmA
MPRSSLTSVGQSVDGSPTVDGSGKFDPVRVVSPHDDGANLLWVVPAGTLPPSDGTKSVSLLPGFGWGEGTHPSTYMCLQYICDETAARPGCSVMDYGTGSGVLALAAGAMGAQRVIGVDKDDEILEHAMENVEHNSLASVSMINGREVMVGSEGLYIGDDHRAASFDVTVANMLPAALCKLSSAIAMSVAEDAGVLALCGCNRDEVPSVKAAFVKAGIEFIGERSKLGGAAGAEVKEYVLLMGRRPRRYLCVI